MPIYFKIILKKYNQTFMIIKEETEQKLVSIVYQYYSVQNYCWTSPILS